MYALAIWENGDTLVPTIVGPYNMKRTADDDADTLRKVCWRVQVAPMDTPSFVDTFLRLKGA